MKAFLPFLIVALFVPAPAAGSNSGFDAGAVGSASFTVYDWATWEIVCDSSAAYGFETLGFAGGLVWDAPECEGDLATGVVPLTFWCTDACFNDCWWWPDLVTCETYYLTPSGGSAYVHLTLARDGAFTFQVQGDVAYVEGFGHLVVTSWPYD